MALCAASATALAIIAGVVVANTGRLILQTGDLHLQAGLTRLCALLEDAEDDGRSVQDFDAERKLEVSLLAWAQLAVDEDLLGRKPLSALGESGKLSELSFTHEGRRRPRLSLLDDGAHGLDAETAGEPFELRE